MLKITTLISILFSLNSFASTNGGGVLLKNSMMRVGFDRTATGESTHGGGVLNPKEIIFSMGQKDGLVKFAYGQLIENKWQIEKFELPTQEILKDEEVVQALKLSETVQNWAPLK